MNGIAFVGRFYLQHALWAHLTDNQTSFRRFSENVIDNKFVFGRILFMENSASRGRSKSGSVAVAALHSRTMAT